MANQLKMAQQQAIQTLMDQGWSQRRIARELGVHRDTVARYFGHHRQGCVSDPPRNGDSLDSKPAISITGSAGKFDSKPAIPITGSVAVEMAPARSKAGRQSLCDPLHETIIGKLEAGLTAQRICQDLVSEHGFAGSYSSVRRFVQRFYKQSAPPFRRMECAPGVEAQIDFGSGARIVDAVGKRRSSHVLRMVLSHSRKAYSEAVLRQTTDDFIACIENAFWDWGGVPRTLVVDNLKAAVTQADWYDPDLNPKIAAFCKHYGTVMLPTKPYTPRHKAWASSCTSMRMLTAKLWRTRAKLRLELPCLV